MDWVTEGAGRIARDAVRQRPVEGSRQDAAAVGAGLTCPVGQEMP